MGYSLNLNQTEEEQKNMSTFSYYNYQFSRLVPSSSVQEEFSTTTVSTTVHADGNFARKQEILSEILAADSDGSRKIVFRSPRGKKRHLHSYLVPYADGMAVMKISNRRRPCTRESARSGVCGHLRHDGRRKTLPCPARRLFPAYER